MSAPLVFMDTETTGLSLDDDIWEFAAILRESDGAETELHMFIEHDRAKCAKLPEPFRTDHYGRYLDHYAVRPEQAFRSIFHFFGGSSAEPRPHVVGAVPNFDTERIARALARHRPDWRMGWHYHLIDVENLAVGYLQGTLHASPTIGEINRAEVRQSLTLPWDSNELSEAVGVDPEQFERHTAMGDVRWAMAIYDAVMGGAL